MKSHFLLGFKTCQINDRERKMYYIIRKMYHIIRGVLALRFDSLTSKLPVQSIEVPKKITEEAPETRKKIKMKTILELKIPAQRNEHVYSSCFDYNSELMIEESWFTDGQLHRKDGPALLVYNSEGFMLYGVWFKHGKRHRVGRPCAMAWTRSTGNLICEEWFTQGQLHRIGGPASQFWEPFMTNHISHQSWYVKGKLNRIGGPAKQNWQDGVLLNSEWFTEGNKISRDDIRMHIIRSGAQEKVLRAARLLKLGQCVPGMTDDVLSIVGKFLA